MIVVLTGAGISQESGISTFRDSGGLWENENIEDVATPRGYRRNPEKVLDFYNKRRAELLSPEIAPNAAHRALAVLEAEAAALGEEVLVVTQNVDNLHERAGTKKLLHMHGELLKVRCEKCQAVLSWEKDLSLKTACPECGGAGRLRPHIVWFEEMPLYMREIEQALAGCSLFVSVGTSGVVYPAAGFVSLARQVGAKTLELNLERSLGAASFHDGRYGKASVVVPAWVEEYLGKKVNLAG
jgi:NAD-dependent deacetylase